MVSGKKSGFLMCQLRRCTALLAVISVAFLIAPAVAQAAAPGPPTSVAATVADSQVILTWTAPSGASPAVSDYLVEYSSDGGYTWTNFSRTASTATTATVTSLTNTVAYKFRVTAFNSDGFGTWSSVITVTPLPNHTINDPATYSACPTGVAPAAGFSDYTSTDVDCIKYYGITKGTTATTYSPLDPVPRWMMALFLTRMASKAGITLGDGTSQGFSDIGGYSAEIQTAINQLKQMDVTTGTTATTYSPDDNVTREQMALFLDRLLKKATPGPGGNTEYVSGNLGPKEIKSNDADHNFTDLLTGTDSTILMESLAALKSLFNLGVVTATTGTTFEPRESLTRRTMATWITNALDHTTARPKGLTYQASTYRTTGTPQISFSITYRDDNFAPIVGAYIDTFRYTYSIDTTVVRFETNGWCSGDIAVTTVGSTKCTVDAGDPVTDANGDIAEFWGNLPATNKVDFWAWTAATGTVYDNDVHATGATKILAETTAP